MKVEVKRSARRKRTISAHLAGNRLIVQIPAAMSERDESHWVEKMKNRLIAKKIVYEQEQQSQLVTIAEELNNRYLQGKAVFSSISYSERQKRIFGSCTVRTRSIRISPQLRSFPSWVLTYVVLHELAHILHPDHSKRFWALVRQYPLTDRARGFLSGDAYGKRRPGK
jgi:predicted metal-dependent hydrolase